MIPKHTETFSIYTLRTENTFIRKAMDLLRYMQINKSSQQSIIDEARFYLSLIAIDDVIPEEEKSSAAAAYMNKLYHFVRKAEGFIPGKLSKAIKIFLEKNNYEKMPDHLEPATKRNLLNT